MTLNDRQRELVRLTKEKGFASVEELARRFGVTTQTIRRDINSLCDQGLLRRYHGGAGLPSSARNIGYNTRKILNHEEKRIIAKNVAERIPDYASLFINLGTTTEEVARALYNHNGLRVITNNLNIASILANNPKHDVIITGGQVRARDLGVTGNVATDCVKEFKVDYGIFGVSGIEEDGTLRDYDYQEVRVTQAMIGHSREVFMVADYSKFGRSALVRLGHISEVDVIFTDQQPPESMKEILEEANVRLHISRSV